MIIDPSGLENGAVIETDLCIVGGGPAGIVLAKSFAGTGTDVCLVEAGAMQCSAAAQSVYEGRFEGTLSRKFPQYLTASRLSCFGGSSNHWAGWCRPLDAIDFSVRHWMPHSGWPIAYEDLLPYYAPAAALAEVQSFGDSDPALAAELAQLNLFNRPGSFFGSQIHISSPTRFGLRYREDLQAAYNIRVLLGMRAVGAKFEQRGTEHALTELSAAAGSEKRIAIRARQYVLACGGIENARLLLMAQRQTPALALSAWTGKGFIDHPETTIGVAVASQSAAALNVFAFRKPAGLPHETLAALYPEADLQTRHQLPNFSIQLTPVGAEVAPAEAVEISRVFAEMWKINEPSLLHMRLRLEPRVSMKNSVELGSELDDAGLPKVVLKWSLSSEDLNAFDTCAVLFAREFSRQANAAGAARVKMLHKREEPWFHTNYAAHHIGTTRMQHSAGDGAVDADCKVHGISNLFAAGSSVFPTAGVSNPTLTILALALRLARHLEQRSK